MGLRASKQATTKKSPYEIVFGKTMTLPLDVAFQLPNSTSFERIEKNVLDEQIKKNKERTVHTSDIGRIIIFLRKTLCL